MRKSLYSSVTSSSLDTPTIHIFYRGSDQIHAFVYDANIPPLDIIDSIKNKLNLEGAYSIVVPNIPYKIVDSMEGSPVKETIFYKACTELGLIPTFELCERSKSSQFESVGLLAKSIEVVKHNQMMIGPNYIDLLKTDTEEIFYFRKSLARTRILTNTFEEKYDSVLRELNEYVYALSEPPISESFQTINIQVYGENLLTVVDFSITPKVFVNKVIKAAHDELIKKEGALTSKNPDDYVLKVVGWDEYLCPYKVDGSDWLFSDFDSIRRSTLHYETIKLEMTLKENILYCKIDDNEKLAMKHLDMFLSGDFWSAFDSVKRISQRSSTDQVGVTIQSVENLYTYVTNKKEKNAPKQMSTDFNCYFKAELIYGENPLCSAVYSNVYEVKNGLVSPKWRFTFAQLISTLPAEAKIIYSVYLTKNDVGSEIVTRDNNDTCLGTVNVKLVTHTHDLVSGDQQYFLWCSDPNPIAMCCNAVDSKLKLHVEYPALKLPMKMDTFITKKKEMQVELEPESMHQLSAEETVSFNKLLDVDAMAILSTAETRSMWDNRYYVLKTKPRALPRICMAVNYTQPSDVHELHRLLTKWPLLSPHEAIELLDFRYPDPEIRAYALRCIDTMDDDQLVMYLPQLVQALKFELHHHSALATFLLRRALRNRRRIGHNLFWFLRAEIHDERVTGRYGVLLEAFLLGCGKYKAELLKEVTFQTQLVGIANKVKTLSSRDEQKAHLKSALGKLEYPNEMALPLNSTFRIKRAVPNTGNVFSSKKKPLLLILENADPLGQPIMVIQKVGDDLRQDILTLQILRIMNNIWKNNNLDLCMLPYQCIATGNEIGMLELVKNSETYGAIMAMDESKFSVIKDSAVTTWLKEQCARPESNVTYPEAVENFTYSCAGYCVATYLLGIGDRHSDNVMVTRDGKFFHIDFGHFLGNFKEKFGVKRERTPFKFTQHFAHVLDGKGSPQFKKFEEICLNAFTIIRKHGSLFIYLFRLMLATGIPELQSANDIEYMRRMFMFDKNDEEAREEFRLLIYKCLDAWSQTVNDWIHDFVHYRKK